MRRFLSLLVLLLLAACARPEKPLLTELPEAATLLQQLAVSTGQVDSLDAAAAVKLSVKGKRFSSHQFLLLEKPDRLRTDVLTGFGSLLLQLTTDGEQLAVFVNTSKPARFYRGPATTANLVRFTRIPLAARDMVRLLLYDPPLINYQRSRVTVEEQHYLLRLTGQDRQQELLFDPQLRLVGCRYFTAGKLFLEVAYQKFSAQQFPQRIRISFPAEETEAVLKFSELLTNVKLDPERFRLQPPARIPVESLP